MVRDAIRVTTNLAKGAACTALFGSFLVRVTVELTAACGVVLFFKAFEKPSR